MATDTAIGEINPNALYTLERAKAVTGWGTSSFREARKAGLPVLYFGRRAFVRGLAIIEHIEKHASRVKYPS